MNMWRCLKTQHTLAQTALAKKHHDQAVSHANSMETKAVKAVALPPATLCNSTQALLGKHQ